jgi:hypothetical protein
MFADESIKLRLMNNQPDAGTDGSNDSQKAVYHH